jgi:hypothetical protein
MFPDSGRRCGDPLVALTLAVAALFQPAQAHLWLRPRT